MPNEYHNIIITIKGNLVRTSVKREENESRYSDYVKLKLSDGDLDLKVLEFCRRLIEDNKINSKADFQLIGRLLHKVLFIDPVRKNFNLLRDSALTSGKMLRVELEFKGNDKLGLSKLPWEYLCYQDSHGNWEFVSTVAELVLTRYEHPGSDRLVVNLDEKRINVLLVVLNPGSNTEELPELDEVGNRVYEQLNDLRESINIEVDIEYLGKEIDQPVTWERFTEAIAKPDCRPHILHIIAHGKFDKGRKGRFGKIAFPCYDSQMEVSIEGGNIKWKPDNNFVDILATEKKLPRFAFLHMCEGGAIDKEDTSAGVALRLAQKGVPAVVAMQHNIEIPTSIDFSKAFYKALGEGRTIDEAVQRGRLWIAAEAEYDNRAFGTPVLYLSTRSDSVLPKIPKASDSDLSQIPKDDRESQTKSLQIIFTNTYDEHLLPIILEFQNSKKLDVKKLRPISETLSKLAIDGNNSDKFIEELSKMYQKYDPFVLEERLLRKLCSELMEKVRSL